MISRKLPWDQIYRTWTGACTELGVQPESLFGFVEIEATERINGYNVDWITKADKPTSYVYRYAGHPRYGILDTAGTLYDSRSSSEEQAAVWMRAFARDRMCNRPIVWEQRGIFELLNNLDSSLREAFPDMGFIWNGNTRRVLPIQIDFYEEIPVPANGYDLIRRGAEEAKLTDSECQLIKYIDPSEKRRITDESEVTNIQDYLAGKKPQE